MSKIRDIQVSDNRSLLVKAVEYKNTRIDYLPPVTLGKPNKKSSEYKNCMAMDTCISNVLAGYKDELSYMAMPKFVGYAMLSNVSQEALIRAGVETIADEMTRKLVEWTYDNDDGKESDKKEDLISKMEEQAAKYKLKEVINQALVCDGNFGGCLIYIDVGELDDDEKMEPLVLDEKTFRKGSFKGFKVIEPVNAYPGTYNTNDPTSKDYFVPIFWYILGKPYHASRFIYIASNPAPLLLKPAYNFFGIPRAQLALDYVAQFVSNRESAQELLNKFSLTCWKTNMNQVLQGASCSDLVDRVKLLNKLKHNSGTMVLDKETEDMIQVNTPLGGVRDIVEMSLNLLTAVWRIPKIKYLGEGEGGLNASSKEQMRSFYDFILGQKEKVLTTPFEIITKIFQLNLGMGINDSLGFRFPSLVQMDDEERASLNKMQADRDAIYLANGVLSQEEVRQRLSLDKNSEYTMIDVSDVPEVAEEPLENEEVINNEEEREVATKDEFLIEDEFKESNVVRQHGRFFKWLFNKNSLKYENCMRAVKNFKANEMGTYDLNTGKLKNYTTGYCVTFHQNEPDENGNFKSRYGRYIDKEYDELTNEIAKKYNAEVNIGYFDGKEISFWVKDEKAAQEIARKYNQHSYWDCEAGTVWENDLYDKKQNPMEV